MSRSMAESCHGLGDKNLEGLTRKRWSHTVATSDSAYIEAASSSTEVFSPAASSHGGNDEGGGDDRADAGWVEGDVA